MALFLFQDKYEDTVRFGEEVSHHLLRSVRKNPGDQIHATDGEGQVLLVEISKIVDGRIDARVIDQQMVEKEWQVTVACSLIKKESRFEIFLEKATELGVHSIVPLICERTLKPRMRLERSMKIISAAAQQSFNAYLPRLDVPVSLEDFLESNKYEGHERFVATAVDRREAEPMEAICTGNHPTVILIGPEGDFSEQEKASAMEKGWVPVSLGENRLRTETAAMMAVQIAKSCHQFKSKLKQ